MTLNKEKVMQALLSADSNISSEVISYVGSQLKDDNYKVEFNHQCSVVWEACGICEQDTKDFARMVNTYMDNLPDEEKQRSRAIEFVVNSGNKKWITIAAVLGLQKMSDDADDAKSDGISDDFKKLLMAALKRKFKDRDEE